MADVLALGTERLQQSLLRRASCLLHREKTYLTSKLSDPLALEAYNQIESWLKDAKGLLDSQDSTSDPCEETLIKALQDLRENKPNCVAIIMANNNGDISWRKWTDDHVRLLGLCRLLEQAVLNGGFTED